ncbi:hypothetical protein GCM10020331_071700 [Ectobacillus funiculus]
MLAVFQFQHEITREEEKANDVFAANEPAGAGDAAYGRRRASRPASISHGASGNEPLCRGIRLQARKKRFHISGIQPAFGNIYDNYAKKLKKAYKEALNVLTIKKKFPIETAALHSYGDMGIYQLIDLLLEKQERDGSPQSGTEKKLHDYDQKA